MRIRRFLIVVGLVAALPVAAIRPSSAAEVTEQGFAVPGQLHRGGAGVLHRPSGAGMPAAVADFLAGRGHGRATLDSLRVLREMAAGNSGATVLDLGQEVQGLAVYGVRARAIFDAAGNLISISENVVPVGPVAPAAIDAQAALEAAMDRVHPGVAVGLVERGRAGNSVSFTGDDFFHRDPIVTRVAVPAPGSAMQTGFLVETWSETGNRLHHTLVDGNGDVLEVQLRTNNDSYNVFAVDPDKTPQDAVSGPGAGNAQSPAGWLFSGSQTTTSIAGNNAHAYLDRDSNNNADPGGATVTDGNFTTSADLSISPSDSQNREVAVQNLFYLNNIIHDVLYRHGFDEATGNFQEDNFGLGGSGSDSVNAEAQDGGGMDNANFATPSDGSNPRMQMYLWNNLRVDAGSGSYPAGSAEFGPSLNATGVSGALVDIGNPGCQAGDFSPANADEIAMVNRGTCAFETKVQNAQNAGYVAAIVVNTADAIITMGDDPNTSTNITIPSALVASSAGASIRNEVPPVSATLSNNPKDGDLDSDIVWHEYGHGLTWRMVGNMTGPMGGALGEGMSDVLAIVVNDDPTVGEYSYSNPIGIRTAPYDDYKTRTATAYPDQNPDKNGRTYEDFVGQVHTDGEIYAAAIWRLWESYRGDTASYATLAEARTALMDDLVTGLSMTGYQCNRPTFPTMRDGILTAIGGDPSTAPSDPDAFARWCKVWDAFALYGVGEDQSTTCTVTGFGPFQTIEWTWTEGFAVPAACAGEPPPANETPTVSITSPADGATFNQGTSIAFAGTASDPEDGDLTGNLAWTSSIDGAIGSGGSFSATLSVGTHTVTAAVSDSGGAPGNASITVTVNETTSNQPPVANAGADQTYDLAQPGNPAVLNGSGSDPDVGDTLTYQWTVIAQPGKSNPVLESPNSATTNFTSDKKGTYTIQLTVSDGQLSSSDTVNVEVVDTSKGGGSGGGDGGGGKPCNPRKEVCS